VIGPSLSLRTRLMAVLALAAIVPTVLVSTLAIRRARTDVEREVVRGRLALVRALGAGLDTTLQDHQRALALVGAAWAEGNQAAPDSTRRLLARLHRELPLLRRVAVLDPDGARVAGDDVPLDSFTGAGAFGGFVGDASFDARGARVVVWAQARGRTGELAGYLAAELDLGFIGQSLRAARPPQAARLFVVDGDGRVIASSDASTPVGTGSLRGKDAAVDAALAAADDGSREQDGVLAVYRNLASYQTTRGVSWAILLEQPTKDAYVLARAARRDALAIGALVLLGALALGWLLARALTRPLERLVRRVDALAAEPDGGPAEAHAIGAPGELGLLAARFEDMARRVEERERLRAALARGERLATVGALAAGVAHEINNPLTTILGYANLLLEDKPPVHGDRAALELVAGEARRVQGIVRRLLDYSRAGAESSASAPLDVRALCERTAALCAPSLRARRVELVLDLADDLPRPLADERRLEQVFVNLAQNAAQAMDGGGKLTIVARPRGAGPGIEVAFVDDGPGIPAELLGRIFEPFFTTKGPGMGTGLGLAVAQQIVLDHGGRIEVESQLGRGSTFRVVLAAFDVGDVGATPPPPQGDA
jgi:signal transduction histidine kinase